jgi:hypothetical protein
MVANLAFIPMTDVLFDHLATVFPAEVGDAYGEFWKLSRSGAIWIGEISKLGRTAYIETEYFGGVGAQAAAVWEAGRLIYGPKKGEIGPINDALQLLGVVPTPADDEFAVAGLGRHRSNEEAIEAHRLAVLLALDPAGDVSGHVERLVAGALFDAGVWTSPRESDGIQSLRVIERSPGRLRVCGKIWDIGQTLHPFWLDIEDREASGSTEWTLHFDIDENSTGRRRARHAPDVIREPGEVSWVHTLTGRP